MSDKLNLLISVNAYSDLNPTNHPSKNIARYTIDLQGIDITKPVSSSVTLAAGQTLSLFSGEVSLSDDNTTTYNLSLKSGTSNTYTLAYNSGTAPVFKTARTTGADATTAISVTKNSTLLIFTSTAGTALSLISGGVVVGDEVRLGSLFNAANQGKFKILARTATSFTVENASGVAEGAIVLGAGFASQISANSAAGVQVGDKVAIAGSFSSVSTGTYDITDVAPTYIEFYSIKALPSETAVLDNLQIFNSSKQFLFIESDKKTSITIDGAVGGSIEPFVVSAIAKPGVFMRKSAMFSCSITNTSSDLATIYYLSAE